MKFEKSTITIDRELSDLDHFALEFIEILEKYTPYVLVSGYVAISPSIPPKTENNINHVIWFRLVGHNGLGNAIDKAGCTHLNFTSDELKMMN